MTESLKVRVTKAFAGRYGTALVAINLTLIGVLAGLGVDLLLPGETFATGQGYRLFAQMMPERTWAITLLCTAAIGLYGFFSTRRSVWIASAVLLATAHGLIAILIFLANPLSWGTVFCAPYAVLGYYLVWRRTA